MPPGSLIPRDVKKRLGMLEKFAPKEIADQIKILSEAERSFVIPVRYEENGKEKYLIIAGMLLSEKVPVNVTYDETDLKLIQYALEKASNALAKIKIEQENEDNVNENENADEE